MRSVLDEQTLIGDLAAIYYAATLWDDPLLDPSSDPEAIARYLTDGRSLCDSLIRPEALGVFHCPCQTSGPLPDVAELVTVHDHRLVVMPFLRGPMASDGIRLEHRFIMDIPMVANEKHLAIHVPCNDCNSLHNIPLRTLRKVTGHRNSTDRVQIPTDVADMDATLASLAFDNLLPEVAFLELTGALRPGQHPHPSLVASLQIIRAAKYARAHGPSQHLDRLTRLDDPNTIRAGDRAEILAKAPQSADLDAHIARIREAHPHG